jgi:hypothetical protein
MRQLQKADNICSKNLRGFSLPANLYGGAGIHTLIGCPIGTLGHDNFTYSFIPPCAFFILSFPNAFIGNLFLLFPHDFTCPPIFKAEQDKLREKS